MIVYRSDGCRVETGALVEAVARFDDARGVEAARARLVELGVLEAAVEDARHPERDAVDATTSALREAMHAAGRALVAAIDGHREGEAAAAGRCRTLRAALDPAMLPASVEERAPEGYVHYGVFPERYVAAARRIARTLRPARAVCVGLRSIGTSLSAAAAAALAASGVAVRSFTVRPRGAAFARELRLDSALARALVEERDALFLICDEGPGLSGSSFAAACRALTDGGAAPERVLLLPSWDADGSTFVSDDARRSWARHRRFVVDFDPRILDAGGLVDLSAGAWRTRVFSDERDWPATQPRHERRKYLAGRRLYKFAGFGRFGEARVQMARDLASAGFGPPVVGFAHGFVEQPWLSGRPLDRARPSRSVARVAAYLEHRRRFVVAPRIDATALVEMTRVNATTLFGAGAPARMDGWARAASAAHERARTPAVHLDARLQPVEWLDAALALKLDAVDHGVGHFHPGPHDRAWDVAGACVELFDEPAAAKLVAILSRTDETLPARMPLYEAAYLAWHCGYAQLAAASTPAADAERWARAHTGYRARLERRLFG
ncbi:MAG: hypothetical protein JWN44_857 [Myxococcales bacterium]|nr:hypothetical protein [Myxococcales bacterium]